MPAASAASQSLILYTVGPATFRALKAIRDTHLPYAQIYGEEAGTGERLAHIILEHYNGLYNTRADEKPALLFLVGEQRRDIIPKTLMSESLLEQDRIQVDELVLYETGEMVSFEGEFRAAIEAGEKFLQHRRDEKRVEEDNDDEDEAMWVVVFSPTGCDAMLRTLNLFSSSPNDGKSHNSNNLTSSRADDPRGRRRRRCFIATIGPTTRDHLRSKYGFEPDVCAAKPSPEGVGKGIEVFMQERRTRAKNKK